MTNTCALVLLLYYVMYIVEKHYTVFLDFGSTFNLARAGFLRRMLIYIMDHSETDV